MLWRLRNWLQFDLPRETSDIDVVAAVVRDKYSELFELAGKGSPLHKKHKIYLDLVGAVATLPGDYEDRLIAITPSPFKHLRLYVMELHDIVLAKLNRDQPKDVQDVEYLARATDLDPDTLRERYETELRHNVIGPPERADGSLRYWIRSINEIQSSKPL